jgi:hypothetical protein
MRILAVLAVLASLVALGGCFHHQQVMTEPTTLPPLK